MPTDFSHPSLEQSMDRTAYELLSKNNPRLLNAVRSALKAGRTPEQIYRRVQQKLPALTASLVWCAAAYIKAAAQKGLS